MLSKFGSKLSGGLKSGDSFVMVGQKGLLPGKALEKVGILLTLVLLALLTVPSSFIAASSVVVVSS